MEASQYDLGNSREMLRNIGTQLMNVQVDHPFINEATKRAADEEAPTLAEVLKETALLPVRIFFSEEAIETYTRTVLYGFGGSVLYGLSVIIYIWIYLTYIPNLRFASSIHLQFDHVAPYTLLNEPVYHPHGLTSLTSGRSVSSVLVSQQRYDVSVKLTLPRTPTNVQAGNFMVSVALLAPSSQAALSPYSPASPLSRPDPQTSLNTTVVARSSRPTILPYVSPWVEMARMMLHLPKYVIGWQDDTVVLDVPMMEGVKFDRGWRNLPTSAWVELSSRERLQIYSCDIQILATLHGIRRLMYHHRILSFLYFTSVIWSGQVISILAGWYYYTSARQDTGGASSPRPGTASDSQTGRDLEDIKREDKDIKDPTGQSGAQLEEEDDDIDNMSDTERTFPTYGRQPILRYTSPASATFIKQEDDGIASGSGRASGAATEGDASGSDLSDEEADFVLERPESMRRDYDSGLGTSVDSSARGSLAGARRRRVSDGK